MSPPPISALEFYGDVPLRQVIELSSMAVSVVRDGRIVYANPTMRRLLGDPIALLGRPVAEFIADEGDRAATEDVLCGEGSQVVEIALQHPDGSAAWLLASSSRLKFEGETATMAAGQDITSLKRAEARQHEAESALRASEERNRLLFEHAGLGMGYYDVDGKLLQMNRIGCEAMGREEAELVGKDFVELYGERGHEFRARIEQAIAEGVPLEFEDRWTTADGVEHVYLSTNAVILDAAGEPDGVLIISEDLTARVAAAEEASRRKQQMQAVQRLESIGQLAGGVAHDFNNLLTVMTGHVDIAQAALAHDHPVHEDLQAIGDAGRRAAKLVHQLLAFSRRQVLDVKPVDLHRVIDTVHRMFRRIVGPHIEIVLDLADELSAVRADPSQLEQVLLNLAGNARDAMPAGGRLTIRTYERAIGPEDADLLRLEQLGAYVVMEVTDTGEGMDEATRSRVFEPFFTTKELGKGSGLGLATVYGIVRQSGGAITVESEPGRGTTFIVHLSRATQKPRVRKRQSEAPPPSGSETVLVVEDEPAVLRVVARTLGRAGYRVLTAEGPHEALAVVAEGERIDLLLSDVVMPEIDGRELAKRLVADHPELKVLFMSGYYDHKVDESGVQAALLQKPFNQSELTTKVREVLDESD